MLLCKDIYEYVVYRRFAQLHQNNIYDLMNLSIHCTGKKVFRRHTPNSFSLTWENDKNTVLLKSISKSIAIDTVKFH